MLALRADKRADTTFWTCWRQPLSAAGVPLDLDVAEGLHASGLFPPPGGDRTAIEFFSKGTLAGKLACGSKWKTELLAQDEFTLGEEEKVCGRMSHRPPILRKPFPWNLVTYDHPIQGPAVFPKAMKGAIMLSPPRLTTTVYG